MDRQISSRKRKYEGEVSEGPPKSKFYRDAECQDHSRQPQVTNVSPNKWAPHMTTPSRCMANDRLKRLKETLDQERRMNISNQQSVSNPAKNSTVNAPMKASIPKDVIPNLNRSNANNNHFQKKVTGFGYNKSNNLDGTSKSKENSLTSSVQDRLRNANTSPSNVSRITSYKVKEHEVKSIRHGYNSWNNNGPETVTSNYKAKHQENIQNRRDYKSNKSETITSDYKTKEQVNINNNHNYTSWKNMSETTVSSYKTKEREGSNNSHHRKSFPPSATKNDYNSLAVTHDNLQTFANTSMNNSKADSSFHCDDNDLDMDWSPICEEEVASQISIVRHKILSEVDPPCSISNYTKEEVNRNIKTSLYIVVDSNVFIHKLSIVSNLLNISFEDGSMPVIFVPWMVVQEIDYIKDGYGTKNQLTHQTLQNRCRRAVNFIHNCLITKKPNFRCETAKEATEIKLKITNPDDSILSSCFNVAAQNQIILLSSDTNLRSKALINNIDSCHPDEIVKRMAQRRTKKKEDNIKKVSQNLSLVCSFIIHAESDPSDINALGQLPWEFNVCIKYMKNNYGKMFKGRVQKQCQKVINDIYEILFCDSTPDENIFLDLCFALLLYIKTGITRHDTFINQAINNLKKLKYT